MNLFIVDLDKDYTSLLQAFFTKKHSTVHFFDDASTAMDHLHEKPNILILNVGIVRVCPLEFIRGVRALVPNICIIVLIQSHQDMPKDPACIELIDDFLLKDELILFRLELFWRNYIIKKNQAGLNQYLEQKIKAFETEERIALNETVLENMDFNAIQRSVIRQYLSYYENNVVEVAQKLKIGKSTLYRLMKEKKW
ncbi:MAG: hypothetical protein MUE33_09815 [Cytophagaceae bacterium]|jgi:DNA-binding NtrC family response regulator|nr:hypothetical protein [Cytophagaceae bacterium]